MTSLAGLCLAQATGARSVTLTDGNEKSVLNLESIIATNGALHDEVVAAFLADTGDAACEAIDARWGEARRHGRQLLPKVDGPDGLYYALLEKSATN